MATYPDRSTATQYAPAPRVIVDRVEARTAAWYEFFPRSAEGRATAVRHFAKVCPGSTTPRRWDSTSFISRRSIRSATRIAKAGTTLSRRSRASRAFPTRSGMKPAGIRRSSRLGTLDDFDWLDEQVRERGMEIALDFAINCSPDHPYVSEHPEWFYKRPDGTIKYRRKSAEEIRGHLSAEFSLRELAGALGGDEKHHSLLGRATACAFFGSIIRTPNRSPFWEFLIAGVRAKFPDAIFLSEAFTGRK